MLASFFRLNSLLITVAALALIACDGEGEPAPSSLVTRTPGAAHSGGDDGFRAFAIEIDAAVRAKDASFFQQRLKTFVVDCSREPGANQLGSAACETPDAVYDGFLTHLWKTDCCGVSPASGVSSTFQMMFDLQLPDEADQYGGGAPRVYGLNVRDGAYMAVITSLRERPDDFAGAGPLRVALSTSWVFENGRWLMQSPLIFAAVLAEEFLQPAPDAGYDAWERFQ